jgi:DNA-binding transcriptional LysR family regulator
MTSIDIRAVNLNLLPALEVLLVERSVSAAARRMHVSQSAMSHSLAKLRELFADPLLVPVPGSRGLALTARAAELHETLPSALKQLNQAIAVPKPFDPYESKQVFRVATVDYFEIVMLPYLLRHLAENAPRVSLEIQRVTPAALASLATGELDLALVGTTLPVSLSGLRRATFYRDPFAVLARKDHPAIGRHLDLETYLSLSHVVVSVEGSREGAVEAALAKLGKTRHIALRVPHFFSAPLAVSCTDYIATMVSTIAARARELLGVRVLKLPIAIAPPEVVALWPRRHDGDPSRQWFRDLFLAGKVGPPHVRRFARLERAAQLART